MTNVETLQRKLADGKALNVNQGTLTFESGTSSWQLKTDAETLESIGGRFHQLKLNRTVGKATQPLAVQAPAVAKRLTGLLESIRLLEMDQTKDVAQLRSTAPQIHGTTREYYEIVMEGSDSISMNRFQFDEASHKRQSVPFTLTYDALAKLLNDLTAE